MPAKTMEIEVNLSVKNLREIEARIKELAEENDRLRAELARIKPSWDDAPEWATTLYIGDMIWMNDTRQKSLFAAKWEERP